jgi:hypothetical protein
VKLFLQYTTVFSWTCCLHTNEGIPR